MSDLRKQIRDHYDAQSLPADKVDALLARDGDGAKVVSFAQRWRVPLALAATVAILAGGAIWWPASTKQVSYAALAPRVVEFFGQTPELPKRSQNPEELRAWLLAQGAPAGFEIPEKLRGLASLGCQVVDVQGRPVYLTCFWREKGELVHLLVAHRDDFRDVPPGTRQFREMDGWSFAAWSEGEVVYTIATAAPMEKLQPFVQAPGRALAWLARL